MVELGNVPVTPEESVSTPTTVEHTLDISFEDINYTVRDGILSKGTKTILQGASGCFKAGDLSMIVGQSGAGKSTLIDILAGYTKPTNGRVLVNGEERNDRFFRKRSCYIMQNDMIQEFLTVEESLTIAANLKLGDNVLREQKTTRIEEIVTVLGLENVTQTRVAFLSGGQKKRLAIGLELVSDPPVMFLDEPTSGLDCSSSKQLVWLLRQLSRQGRTVVVSMHQPSTPLLALVDRLYAVFDGRCAYIGSVPHLLPCLNSMGLQCPPYHNPVDFLMEICSGSLGDNVADRLVDASQNGSSTEWLSYSPSITDTLIEKFVILDDTRLTALPRPTEIKTTNRFKMKSIYATSFWKQFSILTLRDLSMIWRNPGRTAMIMGTHIVIAILMSVLYYNIGDDAKYFRDNYNFLAFSLLFLMFTAFSGVTLNFPTRIPIVRREHFNRWYSAGAYFSAAFVAGMPMQTVCTLVYACISYRLTGQPPEWMRFFCFTWMLILVTYVAVCIGLLNGSIFDVKHGCIFGPFFISPFTVFCGYFLRCLDAPYCLRWLFYTSFLKHGLDGLVMSIFGRNRPKLKCSEIYCHYVYPHKFIEEYDLTSEQIYIAVLVLTSTMAVVTVCSFVIFKFRLKHKW